MKKFSFLSCLIIVVGALLCITCGGLASSYLMTTGIFSGTSVLKSAEQYYYAISIYSADEKSELDAPKLDLQTQGGAGYIYEGEGKFYLLASLYDNKPDAELVKTNLKNQNIESEIICLKVEAKDFSGNFEPQQKEVLENCMKATYEAYKSLYDVAISLDTAVFSLDEAKLKCNTIYSSAVATKTNFESFFKDESLQSLSKELSHNTTQLENLTKEKYESETQNFSSLIKLTYFKILFD